MNPGLRKHQPELGILILPGLLHVLPNADSLLNHVMEIIRDIWENHRRKFKSRVRFRIQHGYAL